MKLAMVGLNHRSAPVELRERLAVPADKLRELLKVMGGLPGLREGLVLSTCNRVEAYAVLVDEPRESDALGRFLAEQNQMPVDKLAPHFVRADDAEAVRHLFRVTAGLDSMVVGESEIAAQVKQAYAVAQELGTAGGVLNPLFQHAFHTAKRIHTSTGISEGRISVPSVGVELVRAMFEDLPQKTVLVIGAGAMGRMSVEHLRHAGLTRVLVTNRTAERTAELVAETGGLAVPYGELDAFLPMADVIVCATASPGLVLDKARVKQVLRARGHRPTLVLDLAVPRNVAAEAAGLSGLYLYNIDDLSEVVARNLEKRKAELEKAEGIVHEEVAKFRSLHDNQGLAEILKGIAGYARKIQERELALTLGKLQGLTDIQRDEVAALAHRLVRKITARPMEALRREAANGQGPEVVDAARRLFDLAEHPHPGGSGQDEGGGHA